MLSISSEAADSTAFFLENGRKIGRICANSLESGIWLATLRFVTMRRSKTSDRLGVDAADACGPAGVLGLSVIGAHEVAAELIEADRVVRKERNIVQPFRHQRVGEGEHDRRIGAGYRRQPLRFELVRKIRPHRADIDERDAAPGERRDRAIDECSPVPPESICRFFSGMPPNDTTRRVLSAMLSKVVPGPPIARRRRARGA